MIGLDKESEHEPFCFEHDLFLKQVSTNQAKAETITRRRVSPLHRIPLCSSLIVLPPRPASAARKRSADLARAFAASTSRSRGGAFVTSEPSSSCAACVTCSTARLKASSLALEGRANPLNFRRIGRRTHGYIRKWRVA